MKYTAVIFDVGDTLVSYVPSIKDQYAQRMKAYFGMSMSESMLQKMIDAAKQAEYQQLMREWLGAPRMEDTPYLRMQIKAALRATALLEETEELVDRFMDNPLSYDGKNVLPGVTDVLRTLKENGVRMGIVSNDAPKLREFLSERRLLEYFDTVVISGEEGIEKPDPRIMHLAMQRMAVSGERTLYVGDHPFDVLCAKHAGMDCAWIASKEMSLPHGMDVKEDYRIRGIEDILQILCLEN